MNLKNKNERKKISGIWYLNDGLKLKEGFQENRDGSVLSLRTF